jgi:TonB family protein
MYDAMFLQKVRAAFEPPPGLSDALRATISVRSNPDGTLAQVRITRPSGSRLFDTAVLEAIRRVKMPPRPDNKADTFEFDFTMQPPEER